MDFIVKTVTRYTVWLIMLYGMYLVIYGHLNPGGGFVGGLVIALSFIHVTLAYGKAPPAELPGKAVSHTLEVAGAFIYVGIGIIGLALGLPFLSNFFGKGIPFTILSAGTIPLLNLAITLKVGMGIYLLYLVLLGTGLSQEQDGKDER